MSSHEKPPARVRPETASSAGYPDPFPGAILGMTIPSISSSTSNIPRTGSVPLEHATSSSRMATYTSRHQPQRLSTHDIPPPTPNYAAYSSSSSTRFSESPGPFSRTSTPTSISSHSPGIPLPSKTNTRVRQISPVRSRPPVTRRKIGGISRDDIPTDVQGLPAVRESLTSSSSSSTVRGGDRIENKEPSKSMGRGRMAPPPPTPPLRLSSKRLPSSRSELKPATIDNKSRTLSSFKFPTSLESSNTNHSSAPMKSENFPTRLRGPPPRPSREGTPVLDESKKPSPVIRSNLSHLLTTGHTRRESIEKAAITAATASRSPASSKPSLERSPSSASASSKQPSRLPSPSLTSTSIPQSSVHGTSRQRVTPSIQTTTKSGPSKEPSPSSASLNKSQTRFGLFLRRTKSPLETSDMPIGERTMKKGPAAGTGHEGYGKYARRGRSSSTSTSASRGRSTSIESTSTRTRRPPSTRKSSIASQGESEIDDFLRERLSPVVITGGGVSLDSGAGGLGIYRTSSAESSAGVRSSIESASSVSATAGDIYPGGSTHSDDGGQTDLIPGLKEIMEASRENLNVTGNPPAKKATLAVRRSFHRSQLFKQAEPIKIPAPIDTRVLEPSPSLDSYNTMHLAVPRTDSTIILTDDLSEGHEGNWLKPKKLEKRPKSPKKWNFFQRAQNSPKRHEITRYPDESASNLDLPVTISRLTEPRSVAHYAMIDTPEQEKSDPLEELLHDMEKGSGIDKQSEVGRVSQTLPQQGHEYAMLLPSPPVLPKVFSAPQHPSSPKVTLHQPETIPQANISSAPKESRLPQVGRIPRVISRRDRLHKPPPQSFSRPFTRKPFIAGISSSGIITSVVAQRQVLPERVEEIIPDTLEEHRDIKLMDAPLVDNYQVSVPVKLEFLAFPPRVSSEVSGSSSSGVISPAGMTAVTPNPNLALSEDEVWGEYDELLDHVASPVSIPSKLQDPPRFMPLRERVQGIQASNVDNQRESSIIKTSRNSESTASETSPRLPPPIQNLPNPLRLSALQSSYQPLALPTTPMSLSDIYAGYGDRSSNTFNAHRRSASSSQYSLPSRHGSRSSRGSIQPLRHTKRLSEKNSIIYGAQKSLRFSALMTSRWLSFDRVLFSPVHDEIRNNRQDRVLVLDGLNNDDWSSFCALTYPDATIYNLSSVRPTSTNRKRDINAWQPPSNHRQIHHASIAHPFPFPKGFFTVVVFRFPAASSGDAYRNAISECKRVLRPGGYLEMSILDIDMVNMGNRARRAVRALKVRMQVAVPDVSLKPTSDELQKFLGRRGFENLNRCMVGVPVAGQVSDSRSNSFGEEGVERKSLRDMLKEADAATQQGGTSSGANTESGMGKMVPRVGRWWYSKCFETSVMSEDEPEDSIWADKALLRECEKRETGFKLLVCYAQKPLNQRRRTVSM